jgi:hypothetical protein
MKVTGAVRSATLQSLERLHESLHASPISSPGSLAGLRNAITARTVPFFVSGTAEIKRDVWLAAVDPALERPQCAAALYVDAPSLEELAAFCAVAEPAAFGRGMNTVLDSSYRSALALAPRRLAVSGWSLAENGAGIMGDVHRLLAPSAARIRAVLSKVGNFALGERSEAYFSPEGEFFDTATLLPPTDS